jgi:hypothetical protein
MDSIWFLMNGRVRVRNGDALRLEAHIDGDDTLYLQGELDEENVSCHPVAMAEVLVALGVLRDYILEPRWKGLLAQEQLERWSDD